MISITGLGFGLGSDYLRPITTDYNRLLTQEPTATTTEPLMVKTTSMQPATAQPIITLMPEPTPAPTPLPPPEPAPVPLPPKPTYYDVQAVAPPTIAPEPATLPPLPSGGGFQPAPQPVQQPEQPAAGARAEIVDTEPNRLVLAPELPRAIVGLSRRGRKIAFWLLLLLAAGATARHIAKRRKRR